MKAIIVVDYQNDFSTSGAIPVLGASEMAYKIADFINKIDRNEFKIIFSRDWHPKQHTSFNQWPIHCLKNTNGSDYIRPLGEVHKDLEILKATCKHYESYSVFYKNRFKSILDAYLKLNKINQIFICGLVKDVCVLNTANDGIKFHYKTHIITDLTIEIDKKRYIEKINKNVIEINTIDLLKK